MLIVLVCSMEAVLFEYVLWSGLMVTSALFYHILHLFNVTIHIRDVCVFLAPLFSSLTVLVTYQLTKELKVHNRYIKLSN